ncbi:MAG: DUF3105 domain-containing protein [Myxococcota bacterium]
MALLCAASGALAGPGCLDGGAGQEADVEVVAHPDDLDAGCVGDVRVIGACGTPQVINKPETSAKHIPDETPIVYPDVPPSSGDHRPAWGRWGEYTFLPPQRWVHNLEHGGIALLYDPCVPTAVVDQLRAFAAGRAADDSGAFRYVLTPYPGLPTPVAAVAWEWTWLSECVDTASLGAFVDAHYRHAPEDFAADGSYSDGWIAR